METFVAPGLGGDARRLQLLGAGRLLFKAAPRAFQEMYWRLVDSGKPPKTIAVVTDEPHMPWELMVPSRNHRGKREVREPLGISAAVGRWVAGDAVAAPQVIPLDRGCFVLAPTYQGADLLEHSEREAALVLGKFQGVRIQPATLAGITSALRGRDASLIHVVAHGKTGAVEQTIRLESEFLTSIQLPELLDDTGVLDGGPTLVVLNACEVGRQVPALVGDSGFAPAFIDAGASAVVAALWSVKDGIANDVARRFYEAVSGDPTRSFADILKDIRKLAYDEATGAEDTYAAYCFYGDPFAAPSS
jgi:hypothetical protein